MILLNLKTMNITSFLRPLNLWCFVVAATGNEYTLLLIFLSIFHITDHHTYGILLIPIVIQLTPAVTKGVLFK